MAAVMGLSVAIVGAFVGAARAADAPPGDVQAHVGLSAGLREIPALADVLSLGPFARVEVGAGSRRIQAYLVAEWAVHEGARWYDQSGPVVIVGDVAFTQVGVGARLPVAVSVLRLVPHVDLGVSHAGTPMAPEVYEEDVVYDLGYAPSVGRAATSFWAQVGGDVAVPLVADAVDFQVSGDVGWLAFRGVGLTLGARMGLAARF